MEGKLVQIGKSLAVTLPVEVVKDLELEKGQTVDVSVHPTTGAVAVRSISTAAKSQSGSASSLEPC